MYSTFRERKNGDRKSSFHHGPLTISPRILSLVHISQERLVEETKVRYRWIRLDDTRPTTTHVPTLYLEVETLGTSLPVAIVRQIK